MRTRARPWTRQTKGSAEPILDAAAASLNKASGRGMMSDPAEESLDSATARRGLHDLIVDR